MLTKPFFLVAIQRTLWLLFLTQATLLCAQQWPQYSLYALNPYAYNPAYAGMESSLVATGVYRQQWNGLAGAPTNRHFNVHAPLNMVRSGVGLRIDQEALGAHTFFHAMAAYNYQLELGRQTLLSVGIGGGALQYTLNGNQLRAPDGIYNEPTIRHNDNLLPEGTVSATAAAAEAGLVLRHQQLEVGLAMQPFFASTLNVTATGQLRLQTVPHYSFSAVWQTNLGENLIVRPSALVKTDRVRTQVEATAIFRWRENIFAGASFRGIGTAVNDAVGILAGTKLGEKMMLGYAFDVPLSALQSVQRGTHELLLRYNLQKPIGTGKLPPIIYNPRFP